MNESVIRSTAKALVDTGLADAGYVYVCNHRTFFFETADSKLTCMCERVLVAGEHR